MKNIILTSTGFENPEIMEVVKDFWRNDVADRKVAIITTASEKKEENEFAVLARLQFFEMGFKNVIFFDIEKQGSGELVEFDIIYVNGGNTYFLLYWAKKSGFDRMIVNFVERGGLYVGVSAGSLIVGPSIDVINYTGGDENLVGLKDFSGIGFINKAVVPHYNKEADESAILRYENNSGVEVVRLADGEAIVVGLGEKSYFIK
jgi:dipeptidase E